MDWGEKSGRTDNGGGNNTYTPGRVFVEIVCKTEKLGDKKPSSHLQEWGQKSGALSKKKKSRERKKGKGWVRTTASKALTG